MKRSLITTTLLVTAIVLIAGGIHMDNQIITFIGGICAGVYSFIVNIKEE